MAKSIFVNNPPKSFESALASLKGLCDVKTSLKSKDTVSFVLSFVQSTAEIAQQAQQIETWVPEGSDAALWFAYPKKSSKKYKSDISREAGFQVLGSVGLEPVSQVAIDDDWSALRFRRVGFIKTMTRAFAQTEEGNAKVAESRSKGIECGGGGKSSSAPKSTSTKATTKKAAAAAAKDDAVAEKPKAKAEKARKGGASDGAVTVTAATDDASTSESRPKRTRAK